MKMKREDEEEKNPDKVHKITKRGRPQIQENPPQEEDLDIRPSSKHRQSRKGKTPRKRQGKAHEL